MANRNFSINIVFLSLFFLGSSLFAYEGRILKRSMEGPDVAEIQKTLNMLGYEVAVDGCFGLETENAVRSFQRDSVLKVDGILGSETIKAIRSFGMNQLHQLRRGESLSVLALRYGSTVVDIMKANDLTGDVIYIGQELVIPFTRVKREGGRGGFERRQVSREESIEIPALITYKVKQGDSAYLIAKRFNITVSAIKAVNNLKDPARLLAGQRILIPKATEEALVPVFSWPAQGLISSGYGWRMHPIFKNRQFHGGIDIAVPTGTNVRAAAPGRVIQAKDMGGFGLGVVIDHGNQVTTWYGHNSKLLVKRGELITSGQIIAKTGNTGVSTGPHLDFRIKVNGKTVNPLHWLP